MQATLQVTKKLTITPLIDIEHPAFADTYSRGVWWTMHGDYVGEKPLPDSYLVDNLKRDASKGTFDSRHDDGLPRLLGFYFGMLHGSMLDPHSGHLSPDVVAVATFTHSDTKRGYYVARRDHFYYGDAEPPIQTESALIEELYDIVLDLISSPTDLDSWYFAIGCLLGSLSIPLFPATDQEWQHWEAEHLAIPVVE